MTDSKPYLSDDPPTYMRNFMKIILLFKEFNGQKPTHISDTYPYEQYVMYPPPQGSKAPLLLSSDKGISTNSFEKCLQRNVGFQICL